MTHEDIIAFKPIFERVQKLYSKPKDAEMCLAYFDALKELPLPVVDAAAIALVKTSRYFPRPADWLEKAFLIDNPKKGFARERWTHTAGGERVATFVCLKCQDTGWSPECGCDFESVPGKCQTHGTGSSASRMPVMACLCRDTNPEWASAHRTTHHFQESR